jgi:hypothetical protein
MYVTIITVECAIIITIDDIDIIADFIKNTVAEP